MARSIASAIERNINYKRVVKMTIERVMHSGAVGIGIRVSGKLGGDVSRAEKFSSGYLKYSGAPAETDVLTAYAQAIVKLGMIGIQVRIMTKEPKELELIRQIEEGPADEIKVEEVPAEEVAKEEKTEVEDLGDIEEETA